VVDLLKLFQRDDPNDPQTRLSEAPVGEDLKSEIRTHILEELARGGISSRCVSIEVRSMGHSPDGREVYQGNLRVVSWDNSVMRLLLGLPLLQAKVRRSIRSSWLHDVCHFHGLWLHPSGQMEDAESMGQLRDVIVRVEAVMRERPATGADLPHQSVWSVPPELEADSDTPPETGRAPL
jgi:hypothetical protein